MSHAEGAERKKGIVEPKVPHAQPRAKRELVIIAVRTIAATQEIACPESVFQAAIQGVPLLVEEVVGLCRERQQMGAADVEFVCRAQLEIHRQEVKVADVSDARAEVLQTTANRESWDLLASHQDADIEGDPLPGRFREATMECLHAKTQGEALAQSQSPGAIQHHVVIVQLFHLETEIIKEREGPRRGIEDIHTDGSVASQRAYNIEILLVRIHEAVAMGKGECGMGDLAQSGRIPIDSVAVVGEPGKGAAHAHDAGIVFLAQEVSPRHISNRRTIEQSEPQHSNKK